MSYDPQQKPLTSAYGEALTAEKTPLVQISARYGVSSEILTPTLGGTAVFDNNMFVASTGTGATNVAAVISSRESAQRPGQGLSFEGSGVFTKGVINSTQELGFLSSESAICFGYNGEEFGVLIASGGKLENQDLTITSAPSAPENASITVDGVLYSVPITNVTVPYVAYQIATYLNANEPRYRFFSNGNTVTALARLPDFGGGSWSFSSGTASASWFEIKNGELAGEFWTKKEDWNVYPDIEIDPTKYNEYKVQVDANIEFYIKDNKTGDYELVHIHEHLGESLTSLIGNPTFRVGWACRNTGNTTNISVSGFFVSSFVEGKLVYTQPTFAAANAQNVAGAGVLTNVLSFRNRAVYQQTANRAEIIPQFLSFGTDSTKPVIFQIIANPTVNSYLDWEYLDEPNSIMEIATNSTTVTGGIVVGTVTVLNSEIVDIDKIVKFQIPTAEFSIAAAPATAAAVDFVVSGTWIEDK